MRKERRERGADELYCVRNHSLTNVFDNYFTCETHFAVLLNCSRSIESELKRMSIRENEVIMARATKILTCSKIGIVNPRMERKAVIIRCEEGLIHHRD